MKRLFIVALLASAFLALEPVLAGSSRSAVFGRPVAPPNQVYYVYYVNIRQPYPQREHLYISTTSYAKALKAMRFLNSYPQYFAYIR